LIVDSKIWPPKTQKNVLKQQQKHSTKNMFFTSLRKIKTDVRQRQMLSSSMDIKGRWVRVR